MLSYFKHCASCHSFAGFNLHMQTSGMIYATSKTIAVMARDLFSWFWCIWVTLWSHGIAWNAQRVNLATNSFHVL
jgi:hypothetical protein